MRPKIAILLPTLGRPDRLEPLVENVVATTPPGDWQLVFALDRDDAASWAALIRSLRLADGGTLAAVAADGSYPAKTNAAYRYSSAPLVLPTADDVVFHEGWLEAVLGAFTDEVAVVGTNDLSPMSHAEHATMPVIRRSYIEGEGCSWDSPGVVFHEGYAHNYVETEICELAIGRSVWRYAPDSVIEHLHPSWGKRESDDTDARGNQVSFDSDRETFDQRRALWPWPKPVS